MVYEVCNRVKANPLLPRQRELTPICTKPAAIFFDY